jgi:hypothetical protein
MNAPPRRGISICFEYRIADRERGAALQFRELERSGSERRARGGENSAQFDRTQKSTLAGHVRTADDVEALRDVEHNIISHTPLGGKQGMAETARRIGRIGRCTGVELRKTIVGMLPVVAGLFEVLRVAALPLFDRETNPSPDNQRGRGHAEPRLPQSLRALVNLSSCRRIETALPSPRRL